MKKKKKMKIKKKKKKKKGRKPFFFVCFFVSKNTSCYPTLVKNVKLSDQMKNDENYY